MIFCIVSTFFNVFGSFRTCSDVFGRVRMCSDTFGYIPMRPDIFGKFLIFLNFFQKLSKNFRTTETTSDGRPTAVDGRPKSGTSEVRY